MWIITQKLSLQRAHQVLKNYSLFLPKNNFKKFDNISDNSKHDKINKIQRIYIHTHTLKLKMTFNFFLCLLAAFLSHVSVQTVFCFFLFLWLSGIKPGTQSGMIIIVLFFILCVCVRVNE